MRRRRFLTLIPLAVPRLLAAESMTNEQIRENLAAMRAGQKGMMNIEQKEGEYLYDLTKRLNARRVLELGTSNGYAAIWFAMALRETGGKLITVEIDRGRYEYAQANFRITGLHPIIDSRLADARIEATRVQGPLDVVLIDAWKPDYLHYYEIVFPKVRKGGVILAHNVVSHAGQMKDFLDRIQTDSKVKTEILRLGSQGLSVTTKL